MKLFSTLLAALRRRTPGWLCPKREAKATIAAALPEPTRPASPMPPCKPARSDRSLDEAYLAHFHATRGIPLRAMFDDRIHINTLADTQIQAMAYRSQMHVRASRYPESQEDPGALCRAAAVVAPLVIDEVLERSCPPAPAPCDPPSWGGDCGCSPSD